MIKLARNLRLVKVTWIEDSLRYGIGSSTLLPQMCRTALLTAIYRADGMESSREQVKNLGRIDDMDRTDAFLNNMHEFEKNMHDFIRLEVETGTTFASSAVETREPGRKQQDIAKSRKAYDTALHFLAEAKEKFPNDPVPAETVKKLQTLQGVLKNLGEQFSE